MTSSTLYVRPWSHQSWMLIWLSFDELKAGPKKTLFPLGVMEQCIRRAPVTAFLSLQGIFPVSPPQSPSRQWSSWFPSSPSDNVHPHRLRILIKHLSNEPDYHIHPNHPSCPTNRQKNSGHIPASAVTTTFSPFWRLFSLLLTLCEAKHGIIIFKKD